MPYDPFTSDEVQDLIIDTLEEAIGVTPERAYQFYEESKAENDGETDHIADATGKFKHFLRTERGWQGAVDAVWPFIEPTIHKFVEGVVKDQEG